jgi:hypothetical protein
MAICLSREMFIYLDQGPVCSLVLYHLHSLIRHRFQEEPTLQTLGFLVKHSQAGVSTQLQT